MTDTRLGTGYNKDEKGYVKAMESVKRKHCLEFF